MAWAIGTDPTNNLKTVLTTFLTAKLKAAPYKAQMPRRSWKVYAPKGSEPVRESIKILLYTGADEEPANEYSDTGQYVSEEMHLITIDVQSDERGAKADEDVKVFNIIRSVFQSPTERAALIALGVYNISNSADALQIDDVEFKRPLNLKCSTDTIISN